MKRLHLKNHVPLARVSASLTEEIHEWLCAEANLRHVSISKLINDLLAAQRDLRLQLAGVEGTGENGTHGPPVMHVLLERTKEEIGRSIDAQAEEIAALRAQLGLALAMLDRSFYAYLLHTPTVAETDQPHARAEALRRYEKWITDVKAASPAPRQRPHRREEVHGPRLTTPAAPGASNGKAPA